MDRGPLYRMVLIGVSNEVLTWAGKGLPVWRSEPPVCWLSSPRGPASLNPLPRLQ